MGGCGGSSGPTEAAYEVELQSLDIDDIGPLCKEPNRAPVVVSGVYAFTCIDAERCELGVRYDVPFLMDGTGWLIEGALPDGYPYGVPGDCTNLESRFYGVDDASEDVVVGAVMADCTMLHDSTRDRRLTAHTLEVWFESSDLVASVACPEPAGTGQ